MYPFYQINTTHTYTHTHPKKWKLDIFLRIIKMRCSALFSGVVVVLFFFAMINIHHEWIVIHKTMYFLNKMNRSLLKFCVSFNGDSWNYSYSIVSSRERIRSVFIYQLRYKSSVRCHCKIYFVTVAVWCENGAMPYHSKDRSHFQFFWIVHGKLFEIQILHWKSK